MRLLCDQNVAQKYVDACIAAPDFQVVTVRDALDPRASDLDIAVYAKTNEYIVLTGDDDFFQLADQCGCIYPSVAIRSISWRWLCRRSSCWS